MYIRYSKYIEINIHTIHIYVYDICMKEHYECLNGILLNSESATPIVSFIEELATFLVF